MTSRSALLFALAAMVSLSSCKPEETSPPGDLAAADRKTPAGETAATPGDSPGESDTGEVTMPIDVMVLAGTDETWAWMESEDGWAGLQENPDRGVPYTLITAVHEHWADVSKSIPVQQKKLVFYRFMLPLILHANRMVRENRARLLNFRETVSGGGDLSADQLALLREGLVLFRVTDEETAAALDNDSPELAAMMDELVIRLDEIPPGLALGQSAYESGYGTSRFALLGNALFGQASFDEAGMKAAHAKPISQGGHRIAAFDWPFDSVRGYVINLNSHPAYEDFRRLRAEQRAAGEPLDSITLADGLLRYSTRGQDYIDDLKGMIRHNGLDRADTAELRDEQKRFLLVAEDEESRAAMEAEIKDMRANGELREIYERMQLD